MALLAIGSANFGLKYGFRNQNRKLSPETVGEILDYAWENGVDTIDTSMGYGDSESVIGSYLEVNKGKDFRIITKINTTEAPTKRLNQSLDNLHKLDVYGILIHNFNYYEKNPGLFDYLLQFKKEGKCRKIGISLYYPEELQLLIDKKIPLDIVQVAYSIFDRRFEKMFPVLKELGTEIHVRSAFLQGLFFSETQKLSVHFDHVKNKIDTIQKLSASTGISIASLCLNFAADNQFIDKIIIGVDSLSDLKDNLRILSENGPVQPYLEPLYDLAIEDVNILFPHLWKL